MKKLTLTKENKKEVVATIAESIKTRPSDLIYVEFGNRLFTIGKETMWDRKAIVIRKAEDKEVFADFLGSIKRMPAIQKSAKEGVEFILNVEEIEEAHAIAKQPTVEAQHVFKDIEDFQENVDVDALAKEIRIKKYADVFINRIKFFVTNYCKEGVYEVHNSTESQSRYLALGKNEIVGKITAWYKGMWGMDKPKNEAVEALVEDVWKAIDKAEGKGATSIDGLKGEVNGIEWKVEEKNIDRLYTNRYIVINGEKSAKLPFYGYDFDNKITYIIDYAFVIDEYKEALSKELKK